MKLHNLRVYAESTHLLTEVTAVAAGLPRSWAFLADQMKRAASSVVLNIAEGTGRDSDADTRRFLGIACGSAREVGACFDILKGARLVEADKHASLADRCDHVARMLGALRKRLA